MVDDNWQLHCELAVSPVHPDCNMHRHIRCKARRCREEETVPRVMCVGQRGVSNMLNMIGMASTTMAQAGVYTPALHVRSRHLQLHAGGVPSMPAVNPAEFKCIYPANWHGPGYDRAGKGVHPNRKTSSNTRRGARHSWHLLSNPCQACFGVCLARRWGSEGNASAMAVCVWEAAV